MTDETGSEAVVVKPIEERVDFLELLQPLLEKGWQVGEDGKIRPRDYSGAWKSLWITANFDEHNFDCRWEHDILFPVVLRSQAVPIFCHDCYKVVARLSTMEQALAVEDVQQSMKHPAKVGPETRRSVKRKWGAYWYNRGMREGQERYNEIKSALEAKFKADGIEGEWEILLKRGCTEYEQAVGPSNRWVVTEKQQEVEAFVEEWVERPDFFYRGGMPKWLVAHIHRSWMAWDKMTSEYVRYEDVPMPPAMLPDGFLGCCGVTPRIGKSADVSSDGWTYTMECSECGSLAQVSAVGTPSATKSSLHGVLTKAWNEHISAKYGRELIEQSGD